MSAGEQQKQAARARLAARRGAWTTDAELIDAALPAPADDSHPAIDEPEVNDFVEHEMAAMREERRAHHDVTAR
ncbi:hypothetical protein [Mycobacterium sp. JS623]|uniref:hypothetical protein n=1 Tax=Mycobacterium sp. JS623 TaxID=212767 RepID=UPI00030074A0|nr:hypothetical protein [Mycobacterium sp. JS623]